MKKIKFDKVCWQNILSLLVIGVFMYFAMATIPAGTNQQKFQLPDGRWEIAQRLSGGNQRIITGNSDGYEKWQGQVTVETLDIDGNRTNLEEVNMVDGLRHGNSIQTLPDGRWRKVCYEMGERVDCEKSAQINSAEYSGYEILSYKYPWFMFQLNAFGFDSLYLESFADTMELIMSTYEFDEMEFDDYYDEALDELDNTSYDSLLVLNSELTIYQGFELLKNSEFRMAVLDRYRAGEASTFGRVQSTYPNYLFQLNSFEVMDQDFEIFCHVFDSIMNSYGPLDVEDPFLIDSLDGRMFATMEYISSNEESSAVASMSHKSAIMINKKEGVVSLYKIVNPMLKQMFFGTSPKNVANIVMSLMFIKFLEADLIKNSVKEAYSLNKGIVGLPTVTTSFLNINSNTSVSLKGTILEDGGANVSTRGIAWGTGFNPLVTDNTIMLGTGTGSFETVISGVNESETYYARSFATNSAGTAYGNCIMFTTNLTVGIETLDLTEINFRVFPNPTSGIITFSFQSDSPENLVLSIVNLNGQIVEQKELKNLIQGENRFELNLSNLENGIYNARLSIKDGIQINRKFLVVH